MRRMSKEAIQLQRTIDVEHTRLYSFRQKYLNADVRMIALKHKVLEMKENGSYYN